MSTQAQLVVGEKLLLWGHHTYLEVEVERGL
jgi:hypothetical protein